jgi:hypothetical protein
LIPGTADELDSIALAEYAALDHLLVVIDAEAMADQCHGHEIAARLVDQADALKA